MEHIGPGPIIPSLLTLQDEHVLNNIWIGGEVTFRARCLLQTNNEAPPPQQFHMPAAPKIPQPQSQTQTNTHPQPYIQTQHSQQQPPIGFEAFGGMGNYSFSHLPSSSQVLLFGTTSSTPLSAFNSPPYYQPIMPSQLDDDDEDEEEQQLVRGRERHRQQQQPQQQPHQQRFQPPRKRRPPGCGTSSHHRRYLLGICYHFHVFLSFKLLLIVLYLNFQ
ncbi:unnamed protein product [Lupinus luteus]|uniref:Uncharacterized protein n=1 Tax=Lupinus luteus TaxID=3873 RepID=A0AAV1WJE5_LUPLU